MKLYIDTAVPDLLAAALHAGAAGVTTNPALVATAAPSAQWETYEGAVAQLVQFTKLFNVPISVQITKEFGSGGFDQAMRFRTLADNVVIKVPVVNLDALRLIRSLRQSAVRVNATCIFTYGQAAAAADAGAAFISVFAGRMRDKGLNPEELINRCTRLDPEIIVGSVRTAAELDAYADNGAHIATLPFAVFNGASGCEYASAILEDWMSKFNKQFGG